MDSKSSRENSDRYWNKYPKKEKHNDKDDSGNKQTGKEKETDKSVITPRERKTVDMLTSRTGGAYIPPAKLRLMQAQITDKSSAAYQRIAWEALKKSVHGCINKVNTSNIHVIAVELLHENIVRGRGLLCKSIIQAQTASPTFTNVYSCLVAIINSKFPNVGELLLKRLVLNFKRGFKQNNKTMCISAVTFIAHLVNQRVAHEILALEILTLLVESPTDDSVEVAIAFLKECGQKLTEVSRKGINAIFEMLRNILHEGELEKRIQYMIEVMYQIRKDGFKDHPAVLEELDMVNEEEQFTHLITLEDVKQANAEDILNVFKFDEKYEENEGKYKMLSKEILDSDEESGSGESGSESEDEEEKDDEEGDEKAQSIIDNTSTNLTILRRTIYLTIQSSLDFEECAHKLMKMELKPGQEIEMCHMFLDCCAEQRTYEKFYGLLAQRFCQINKTYIEPFQEIFKNTFATTHRLDTNRIRNVAKFCAHLLFTDAISWEVLEVMKLNEEDSNSSSRVFIKVLFQELSEYMGLVKLNTRLKDPTLQVYFSGLFPRDNPKNTRFAINFFTSIGLGGLTDELREHLKNAPKITQLSLLAQSSSSGDSSSSSSSDDSSSDSSSDSSEEDKKKTKKQKFQRKTDESMEKPTKKLRMDDSENDYNKHQKEKRKNDDEDDIQRKHDKSNRDKYNKLKEDYLPEPRRNREEFSDRERENGYNRHQKENRKNYDEDDIERKHYKSNRDKYNKLKEDYLPEPRRNREEFLDRERDRGRLEQRRPRIEEEESRRHRAQKSDRKEHRNKDKLEEEDSRTHRYDGRDGRGKDYEWVKSRYEDNIKQLKDKRSIYEESRRRRSRSRDRKVKEEKRSRRRS